MTCKDCIHERVCSALIKDGLPYTEESNLPAEAFCMTFKIHKPEGDLVYGKWIPGDLGNILCSVCGTKCLYIDKAEGKAYYDPEQYESNYCPYCGVKMIKED